MSRYRSEREEKLLEQLLTLVGKLSRRTNRTLMVEVDLTTDRPTYTSIGLETYGMTFYWLTIEKCESALNYKLKQTDDSLSNIFRAAQGRRISDHEFKDILVSNPVGTGVCRFIIGYWSD